MFLTDILAKVKERGIELKVVKADISYHPKSAMPPELLQSLRQHKQELLVYLTHEQDEVAPLYQNPPVCHNPFTPHSSHKNIWECELDSCYCYIHFGYPRFCSGAPCRWIWPNGRIY
jgi:hypothetical protein